MSRCLLVLTALTLLVVLSTQANNLPQYTSIASCDEVCPRNKDVVCKLDCLSVSADGKSGTDCVNHFYDTDGNIYWCWL